MKHLLILVLCVFSAYGAHAQNDPASVLFIRSVVTDTNKVIYIDSAGSYAINELKTTLNKDTLFDDSRGKHVVALVLSRDDHVYIKQQLTEMAHFAWGQGLVKNSMVIPADTVANIFNYKLHHYGFDGWNYFHEYYGRTLYTFSRPLFLRGNTICIFYVARTCGSLCGQGTICLYIKKDGKWVKQYLLDYWIS